MCVGGEGVFVVRYRDDLWQSPLGRDGFLVREV